MMVDLSIAEMQKMQTELNEKYRDKFGTLDPEHSTEKILWAIGELCEAADVLKKNGVRCVTEQAELRTAFTEEVCDALMYLNDLLLCFHITPEEVHDAYVAKFRKNLTRW